eukprot:7138867-Prymnesium_polylepis.1
MLHCERAHGRAASVGVWHVWLRVESSACRQHVLGGPVWTGATGRARTTAERATAACATAERTTAERTTACPAPTTPIRSPAVVQAAAAARGAATSEILQRSAVRGPRCGVRPAMLHARRHAQPRAGRARSSQCYSETQRSVH